MKSGKLDRRITIQNRIETQNSFGEAVISYGTFATVWAEVLPLSGRELFTAAQTFPEAQLKVRIRYLAGVTEKHRILHDGVSYDILHIAEMGRREGLEILVKKP